MQFDGFSSDGTRESSIVTKMFLVEEAIPDERNDDEISDEFQGRHEVASVAGHYNLRY
jgi:hypothetical protein